MTYFLSRINEETPEQDADEENEFHDQLVASIEYIDTKKNIKAIAKNKTKMNKSSE